MATGTPSAFLQHRANRPRATDLEMSMHAKHVGALVASCALVMACGSTSSEFPKNRDPSPGFVGGGEPPLGDGVTEKPGPGDGLKGQACATSSATGQAEPMYLV